MTLQFERKFTLLLLLVFLVLTTIGIAFYQSTVSSQQAVAWERRTQEISGALDRIATATLDANTAVDSFVILDNDSYLAPYNNAEKNLYAEIARLRAGGDLTDTTVAELANLESLIRANFERLAFKVALRKSRGFAVAASELPKAVDRAVVLNIRASIERSKAAETARMQAREQAHEVSRSRTITILIVSCVAGLGFLAFANFIVFRETTKRSAAERQLVEANRGLEERIEERTIELSTANRELQRAGEERSILLGKEQRARRDAEIANRMRDEFMATVSHELRTPLNSILGWARLLRKGKLDDGQTEKAIETIINSAEMQNRLIEDLLDVARIVSGKLDLDRTDPDFIEVTQGTIDSVQPAAAVKYISIRYNPPPVPAIIHGDKNRIEQVMLNLLTNAIKFSPAGSTVNVSGEVDGDFVEMKVQDDGVGIKRDFLPLVFERFRQDASTAAGSGGLGLGLAIVRNLVEIHGGTVGVASEGENCGSEFTVRLPLKAYESMAAF